MAKANVATSALGKLGLSNELVLGALIAELVGTFILTYAVLNTAGNVIVAAMTVLVLVLVLGKLSGGHVNPVVTVCAFATRQISLVKAAGYMVAQFLGAMLAVVVASQFLAENPDPYGMGTTMAELFRVSVVGEWRLFFAEMIGAVIFGFGVSAALLGRREGTDKAFTIGGALLLGLIIATSGSSAIVNPAVALGLGALDPANMWGIWGYALAPVVGGVIGALLYKLLQSDILLGARKKA